MKHILKFAFVFIFLICTIHTFAEDALPAPWKHQDLGKAEVPGTATVADNVYTVAGTADTWGVADGPQILWQPVKGDVEIVARIVSIDNPGKVAHAKASLTIRESLDAGSREVSMAITATDGAQFIFREKKDDKSVHPKLPKDAPKSPVEKATFPAWLKLVRTGNEFTGYESADSKTWHKTDSIKLDIPADAIIGLTASSHKPDVLTTAKFDNVKITGGK